jgi:AcrR family transcriptional regulator
MRLEPTGDVNRRIRSAGSPGALAVARRQYERSFDKRPFVRNAPVMTSAAEPVPGPSRPSRAAHQAPAALGLVAARGEETLRRILEAAVALATREGLEGLSIGRLSSVVGMSKAGLFQRFGSKEELQLATVRAARALFIDRAIRPVLQIQAGLPRLWALCGQWESYRESLDGGCFFFAASAEFDDRPGPVREAIAAMMREWLAALERAVAQAQLQGHLSQAADPAQLAFEINALELGANQARQLFGDRKASARARSGVHERLEALATKDGLRALRRAFGDKRAAPDRRPSPERRGASPRGGVR